MNRTIALIALVLTAGCTEGKPADTQATRRAGTLGLDDPVDSVTHVAASCEFVTTVANPDPRMLVAEFLRRGAAGEFLEQSTWFEAATDCPGHVAGWDAYDLVAAPVVRATVLRDSSGTAVLTYRRLGSVAQREDTTRANASITVFRVDTATIADTIALRRTQFGWRIAGEAPPLRVSYQAAFARGDLKVTDTLRIAALLADWR